MQQTSLRARMSLLTWGLLISSTLILVNCANEPFNTGAKASTSGGSTTPSIAFDVASVQFEANQGSGSLPSSRFQCTYVGDHVVVGVPTGQPSADWLSIQSDGFTPGRITYLLQTTTTTLTPGTYTTTLRFATARADGTGSVYKDLPITYIIRAAPIAANLIESTPSQMDREESPNQEKFSSSEPLARTTGIRQILWAGPK